MGIMARDRAAQEIALMSNNKPVAHVMLSGELQPEPQLPSGWEKCLDLKSGLIYFKDWNSGTVTYRDPRQAAIAAPTPTQRIGLLSISLSSDSNTVPSGRKFKRVAKSPEGAVRLPWRLSTAQTEASGGDSSSEYSRESTMEDDHDQSLDLSLNLPGTAPPCRPSQEGSVCTVEKVRSALERLNPKKRASSSSATCGNKLYENLFTALSLLSPRMSSGSLECSSSRSGHVQCSESGSKSSWSSPATSSSVSEYSRFTSSPSVMSYQGDDEEVQQPRECSSSGARSQVMVVVKTEANVPEDAQDAVMVTVGCKRCLMYVMISKSHPSCPRCGNSDAQLLQLPEPLPKKQRNVGSRSTWNW